MRFTLFVLVTLLVQASFVSNAFAKIQNFRKINPWVIRGSEPREVADYEMLIEQYDIRAIIDLRVNGPWQGTSKSQLNEAIKKVEKRTGKHHDVAYFEYPIIAGWMPNYEELYEILSIMTPGPGFPNQPIQPVYVHCQAGKDRTGVIIGLYRIHAMKWSKAAAWKEMLHPYADRPEVGFNKYLIFLRLFFEYYADPENF